MTPEEQQFHDVGKWLLEHTWEMKIAYNKDQTTKSVRIIAKHTSQASPQFCATAARNILTMKGPSE